MMGGMLGAGRGTVWAKQAISMAFAENARLLAGQGGQPRDAAALLELRHPVLALLAVVDGHGDAGTEDFLVGILEQHEKTAWMLRAHLA